MEHIIWDREFECADRKKDVYKRQVENQVILLCAATNKVLMDIPAERVREFNEKFLDFMNAKYPQVRGSIKETGALSEENEKLILEAVKEFERGFFAGKEKQSEIIRCV